MFPEEKPYTYADIEETEDGRQYELLNGRLYLLASPAPFHGEISSKLWSRRALFRTGQCGICGISWSGSQNCGHILQLVI